MIDPTRRSIHTTWIRLKNIAQRISGFPLYAFILFAAMTAAYNAQIWRMGTYYDDWEGVYLQKQLFSAQQIWNYFLRDRPFSSLTHLLFNPIIGTEPYGWRILGQLISWVGVLLLVRALLKIWPKRVMEIGWIGLLLAIYPGITRQFVVRTSIPHYTSMLLFTASLLLMIKAVTSSRHRWLFTALSIGLGMVQVLVIEYFAGLELVRFFLLYYLMRRNNPDWRKALSTSLKGWLPYAAIFVFFLFYHFWILPAIQLPGTAVKNSPKLIAALLNNPIGAFLHTAEIILQDIVYAVVYVWSQLITPEEIDLQAKATLLSWIIGLVVAAACAAVVEMWHRKAVVEEEREPFPALIFWTCAASLLLGGLPIWIIGRQVTSGIWASRFLFGIVMGAVPLVVIFVVWLAGQNRRRIQSIVLASLLVGSLALQFRTANKYALNWQYQRDYYYQLKWRAPGLEPGSFILAPDTPFSFNGDYEIAYAINILYAPGRSEEQAAYWWFDGPDDMLDFDTGHYPQKKSIDYVFRSLRFQSDMQHALPVNYRPSRGCLQVIDPVYQQEPLLLPVERELFSVNNPGLITEQGPAVAADIFGGEPEHGWCYYYQKADLAREKQQWGEIILYWDEASAQSLKPAYAPEYLPFIEGSLHNGRPDLALELTNAAGQAKDMAPFLCAAWSRVIKQAPSSVENSSAWDAVNDQFNCSNQ